LKADADHAREMFQFAASYFADPEAQYHLAKLCLAGKGAPKDAMTAARWLQLSAEKGDHREAIPSHSPTTLDEVQALDRRGRLQCAPCDWPITYWWPEKPDWWRMRGRRN
jgi:hypothetical protein